MLVDEIPAEYRAEFREQLEPQPDPEPVTPEARRDRIRHLSLITGGEVIEDGEA